MSTSEFLKKASKRQAKKLEIPEDDIEQHFVKFAKTRDCVAYKLIFLNRKGFPDRSVLCPGGRIFFIEFKKKGKLQSPIQIKVMKALIKLGFEYHICDEIGQAETLLQDFLYFS